MDYQMETEFLVANHLNKPVLLGYPWLAQQQTICVLIFGSGERQTLTWTTTLKECVCVCPTIDKQQISHGQPSVGEKTHSI